jgi:hypothetical protein
MENKVIIIECSGGVVVDVKGLPEGWSYEILDHDNEEEHKEYIDDRS